MVYCHRGWDWRITFWKAPPYQTHCHHPLGLNRSACHLCLAASLTIAIQSPSGCATVRPTSTCSFGKCLGSPEMFCSSTRVSAGKNAAFLAFLTVILRWPDTLQPQCMILGNEFSVQSHLLRTQIWTTGWVQRQLVRLMTFVPSEHFVSPKKFWRPRWLSNRILWPI